MTTYQIPDLELAQLALESPEAAEELARRKQMAGVRTDEPEELL